MVTNNPRVIRYDPTAIVQLYYKDCGWGNQLIAAYPGAPSSLDRYVRWDLDACAYEVQHTIKQWAESSGYVAVRDEVPGDYETSDGNDSIDNWLNDGLWVMKLPEEEETPCE